MTEKINQFIGVVNRYIRLFKVKLKDIDRCKQAGRIGIWHAINKFDKNKGIKLITFVTKCVKNSIIKELQSKFDHKPLEYANSIACKERVNINDYLPDNLEHEEKQLIKLKVSNYKDCEIRNIMNISIKAFYSLQEQTYNKIRKSNEENTFC